MTNEEKLILAKKAAEADMTMTEYILSRLFPESYTW